MDHIVLEGWVSKSDGKNIKISIIIHIRHSVRSTKINLGPSLFLLYMNNTGQQNLTYFSPHELQLVNLAVLSMLNSDMYTEFFYQAEFQRYRGLYLCKIVLYVLMKQAETYL